MYRGAKTRSRLVVVALVTASAALFHCGGDDNTSAPGPGASDASADAITQPNDAGAAGSGTVTPSGGGVVQTGDGRVRLEVPPGAVAADTVITIAPTSQFPDDGRVVGGSVYAFGPDGITFAVPVTMIIRYDAARIPSAVVETELRLHKADGASWNEITNDGSVDPAAKEARAKVSSFSTYGVRGRGAAGDGGLDASSDGSNGVDSTAPAPTGALVTASGFDFALGHVRVDGAYVYFTGGSLSTGAAIKRRPLAGGSVETLATLQQPIWGFTTAGSTAFFSTESMLWTVPIAGGTAVEHTSTSFTYSDRELATDGTYVFWPGQANVDDSTLIRATASSATCAARTFANASCLDALVCDDVRGTSPVACTQQGADAGAICCDTPDFFAPEREALSAGRGVTTADGYVYWTENSGTHAWVLRRPVDGSAAVEVVTDRAQANNNKHTFQSLVVASGRVYWFDVIAGTISSVPIAGGTPKVEVTNASVAKLAADSTHVYFTGSAGAMSGVLRFPHAGGALTHVATATQPGDLSLSATEVYFAERSDRSVRKIAK